MAQPSDPEHGCEPGDPRASRGKSNPPHAGVRAQPPGPVRPAPESVVGTTQRYRLAFSF